MDTVSRTCRIISAGDHAYSQLPLTTKTRGARSQLLYKCRSDIEKQANGDFSKTFATSLGCLRAESAEQLRPEWMVLVGLC